MNARSFWTDLFGVAVAQRFVDAGGIRTRVLESGRKGMPVTILIHGTGGHSECYSRNLGPHGEHFHTYAFDLIGHGFSDKPEQEGYEIRDYVEHVRAFMDAEGIEKASMSGESLGGWVAARFALTYPDRIERLVLSTTGGATFYPEIMARIKALSLAAVENASWETVKKRLEFLMADPATVTDDLIATRLRIYTQDGFVDSMRRVLCLQEPEIRRRNMIEPDEWRAIKTPTLVIWTSHDPTAPATVGEEIAGWIPGSRYVLMDKCGHWPQFEDSETFNNLQIAFFRGAAA